MAPLPTDQLTYRPTDSESDHAAGSDGVGDPEDARLYVDACAGSDAATDEIVRRHHAELRTLSRRQTGDDDLADDAVQFAWMQLLTHITDVRAGRRAPLQRPGSLRFWLMKTTRRAVTDGFRAAQRNQRLAQRFGGEELTLGRHVTTVRIDDELVAAQRATLVREAMAGLSDRQRVLVDLLLADPPLSYREISQRTNIPIGSIGPTRQRCIDRIRSEIASKN